MLTLHLATLVACIASFTSAFTIDFNSADHCLGSTLGNFQGSEGTGCQTKINNVTDSTDLINVPDGSFNVIAYPDASKDNKTAVAFYSNPDCSLLIGLSNVPSCVGAGAYRSYEIIKLSDAWAGEYNLQPPQIDSQKPNATATSKSGESLVPESTASTSTSKSVSTSTYTSGTSTVKITSTVTAKPTKRATNQERRSHSQARASDDEVEHLANGKRMEHGAVRRTNQGVYKFHQIAERAWRGVNLDNWDRNIHKRNAAPLNTAGTSRQDLSPLDRRAIPSTSCNLVRSCMINSGDDANFGIGAAGEELLNSIKTLNPSGDDWTYLQQALVVEIVDTKGKSKGFIYAQTELHNEEVQTCSDKGTQSDALTSALSTGVDGQDVSDMRVDLKLLSGTAVTDSLFVSTRSAGNSDTRIFPICEAVEVNF